MQITIPFQPRPYQQPIVDAFDKGYKRIFQRWHRRSGKDILSFNLMVREAIKKVGIYYYFFPTYTQGKKILWDGITIDGKKIINYIPKQLRKRVDNTSMLIELVNGSIIQVIGTDNIDSIVGTNPYGCVFSEYPLQDPRAWQFIRPILAANGGWAIFNGTPRGKNHSYELEQIAKEDKENWFVSILTVDDTNALDKKVLEQERKEMLAQTGNDALFMQEYYVSYDAPVEGAYYGQQLIDAYNSKRIGTVPYLPNVPVSTFWDLGVGDSTTIWFVQPVGQELHLIDYYENSGEGLPHYAKVLQDKGYVYREHYAPHDIEIREFSTGKSRLETAQQLGISFRIVPKLSIEDGIEAARNIFPRCWFDEEKCTRGIECLKSYHKEWDDKNHTWRNRPAHDWASHGADAFRYFAVGYRQHMEPKKFIRRYDADTGRLIS